MQKCVYLVFVILVFFVVLFAGCTQSQPQAQQTTAAATPATGGSADTIKIGATSLGNVLTDANGMTLYVFANDVPAAGTSACGTGTCAANWPIFFVDPITVSAPLASADFWSVTMPDGMRMTTFKGWPLYRFVHDTKSGDVTGDGVLQKWSVAKPDYTAVFESTPQLGSYLTDPVGRTLYVFSHDSMGVSTCTDACIAKWPAYYSASVVAPSLLKSSDFGTVSRVDGISQSSYMGMPLYYYSGDTTPGMTTGEGFNNIWYVANITGPVPAMTMVPTTTATTIATTVQTMSPSSMGGY